MEKQINRPNAGIAREIIREHKTRAEAQLEMRQVLKRIAQGEDLWARKRELNALINQYNR